MATLTIPKYGQHAMFLGSTGSGKTYLAERMLDNVNSYFVFDTQDSLDLIASVRVTNPKECIKLLKKGIKKIQYCPEFKYQNKIINGFILDEIMQSSSKRHKKPRVIYIDEIFHFGYDNSFPKEIPVALATCRQKAISIWISTQRPKRIPTNILSESTYIYQFFLTKYDDIDIVADSVRNQKEYIDTAVNLDKEEHAFIVVDQSNGTFKKYNAIE